MMTCRRTPGAVKDKEIILPLSFPGSAQDPFLRIFCDPDNAYDVVTMRLVCLTTSTTTGTPLLNVGKISVAGVQTLGWFRSAYSIGVVTANAAVTLVPTNRRLNAGEALYAVPSSGAASVGLFDLVVILRPLDGQSRGGVTRA